MTGGGSTRARWRRLLGVAALAALAAVPGTMSAAHAHTELDTAVPADGVAVQTTPGSVQLTFTEPIDAELASVVVRSPGGQNLAQGPARQAGPGLIQPIVPSTEAGRIQVAYRVVSLDGHPVSGTYTFEVLRGDPEAKSPDPQVVTPGGGDDDASAGPLTLLLFGGAAVALVVLAGAFLARRRGHAAASQPHATPPTS